MKVSETVTPKNQDPQNGNGAASTLRRKQQKNGGGVNGARGRNGSSSESQTTRAEKSLKLAIKNEQKKSPSSISDQKDAPERKEAKNGSTSPESKKPWIPCARRSSKPKPLPDILDMELSLIDSGKVCKKFPIHPAPNSASTDAEKTKRKQNSEGANVGLKNINANNNGSIAGRLTSSNANNNNTTTNGSKTNGNANINATTSIERRAVLKRQFALDKAPTSNLKESISDESLHSIHSVTQLLKIERSVPPNNKAKVEDDKEEEVLTGVKLIAARLEAKNANNSRPPPIRNGMKNNRTSDNGHAKSNGNSAEDGNAFNSDTKSGHLQTKHQYNQDSLQKKGEEEKSSIMVTSANAMKATSWRESQEMDKVGTQQILAKSQTTTTAPVAEAPSSVLLNAAAVAVSSSSITGRKKVNSNKTSPSIATPSSKPSSAALSTQVSKSRSSSPEKRGQGIASQAGNNAKSQPSIRSRSNSPVKSPATVKPTVRPATGNGTEANNNSSSTPKTAKKFPLTNSRSSSPRKNSLASSTSTPSSSSSPPPKAGKTSPSLSKQTNQIKEKNGESPSINEQRGRIRIRENKSNLINPIKRGSVDNCIIDGGQSQSRDVNGNNANEISETHSSRRNSRKTEEVDDSRPVKRYALPTIASQANKTGTTGKSVVERGSSLTREPRERSRTRGRKPEAAEEVQPNDNRTIRGKLILKEKLTKEPCKLEANTGRNKSIVSASKNSSSEDVLDYSLSSLSTPSVSSSVSVTSSPSTSWRSRKKQLEQQRIIPSIIMSEYVEGKENGKASTVVKHSQSLFTPLQFIEPLEKTCDIKEGSSLELNVRVRGAEAVVWVKENKIIPNAPPDFQYISEKSKDLYGLRIADVFLQDAGLYVCEAYGTGGSEITCWCEVDVIEASGNDVDVDEDEEDISWEDLDISEEVKSPQPLVVPVIVTSQAEQEREPTPTFETARSKEPSPVRIVPVKQVKNDEKTVLTSNACWDSSDCDQLITTKRISRKSSNNESAFSNSSVVNGTMKKSQSPSEAPAINYCDGEIHERVTEFVSENAEMKTPKEFSYPGESVERSVTATPPVPIVLPEEEEEAKGNNERSIFDEKESKGVTSQSQSDSVVETEKRKLMSQLSSASDESIYLKEPRSGDEGALSSNEETSGASISFLDGKRDNAANDEEISRVTSESPPVSSPFSEQNNERSSSVDSAIGFLGRPLFSDGKFPPRILVGPSSIIALYGEVVHLRVKVQNYGIPKTSVNWFKFINGTYKKIESSTAATAAGDQSTSPEDAHVSISKCGASLSTLTITHINYDDCGRYRVKVQNLLGMDSHDCLLTVEGPPEAPTIPPKVKYDEKSKTILIQWSSCPYDGGSKITGYYVESSIVQSSKTAINKEDQDNWQLLTPQSYSWLCYTLTEPKRGSVYRFRVFGENIYGKGKPTEASLPLLVPMLMEGRRAGSSDALLWSLKSLSQEETSLRADSKRNKVVHECENEMASTTDTEESASSQEEEEPVEYKSVTVRRESFYHVYDKLDELGKGRFGVVFEVVNKETKKSYAGKFVKCIKAKDKERVQLEVQIMNDLEYHPKLICLIDAFEMPREIVIVTQQINGGELFERVVADDFTLTEGDCITFLRQICDAVGYIHTKNIMHLDLKPENILCTSKNSNSVKIIDFGLAQYHDPEEPIRVLFGTAEFVSPEIINYEPIGPSTDNWSVGVITYILLSGLSPFMGDNDNETFSNITRAEFDFDDEAFEQISEDAKDFISNLLVKRPEKRMTADECLNHRWVKESDDKKKVILPTDKLKRFLVRRKWQKTGNAIRALGRITTLYSSRRSSSTSSSPSGSLSMSMSSPPPAHQPNSPSRSGSLATQDSADYDNVFFAGKHQSPPTNSGSQDNASNNNNANLAFNNNVNQKSSRLPLRSSPLIQSSPSAASDATTNRTKFTDPCKRSDSGVCDVGSFSSSLNYD